MKIKEFSITEYGPLSQITKLKLDGFSVVYGKNEEGKSLIVESLLKMLYKSKSEQRAFGRMKRVDRNPSGYVLLEYNGKEEKYPECGSFGDLHEISSEVCRNIFVIQDSDLRIDGESEFYSNINDKLLGLSTAKIEQVKNILQNIGQYTGSGLLKNTQGEDRHLRKRYEDAEKLAEEIDVFVKASSVAMNVDIMLAANSARLIELKSNVDILQKAQKRDQYNKSQETLARYQELLTIREELSCYTQDIRDDWLGVEGTLEENKKLLIKHKDIVAKKDQEFTKAKPDFDKAQAEEDEQKNVSDRVKVQLQPLIYQYDDAATKGPAVQDTQTLKRMGMLSGVATVAAIILSIFTPWIAIVAVGSLLVTLYSLREMRKGSVDTSSSDYKLKQLQIAAQSFGFESASAAEIKQFVSQVEKNYEDAKNKTRDAKNNLETTKKSLEEAQTALNDIESTIQSLDAKIIELRKASNLDKIEEYTRKLSEQQKNESKLSGLRSALQQLLGEASPDNDITEWNEKVEDLERYKNQAAGIDFDETKLRELENDRDEIEHKIEEMVEQVKDTRDKLRDFERRTNQCLEGENLDYLAVEFVEDLRSLLDALHGFSSKVDDRIDACRLAEEILDEVKTEQQGKMEDMFEGTDEILSDITCGEYVGIAFDDTRGVIVIEKKDGTQVDAENLSKGTYDQLYLAVRINLSQKLLGDKKGFFIMDDPFLSSDGLRLKEQIRLLKRLTEDGWQIIYFTAKDEIKVAAIEEKCQLIEFPQNQINSANKF